ncbi:MAG TPA: glycoside hydrolase family 2 TIM barrel-domain containing protein [Candidatus Sulfotelmatobacter sp.]|nr:glycoside hydrolase family 2 TIM barrel-domain containing protein [Candidatus Sulfotelmatobacter sp.]
MALAPVLWGNLAAAQQSKETGPANHILPFDRDWLFGGKLNPPVGITEVDERTFSSITLPHCVAKLSWENWDPASWQDVWMYRRHFTLPSKLRHLRIFLKFDGVMVGATPTINGQELPRHLGGYLPFEYELTKWVKDENTLNVAVDSRWSNVPPEGSPIGAKRVDYLEAGGIYRSAWLKAVPQIFIRDVFVKPVQVLEPSRRIEILCTLDAALVPTKSVQIEAQLRDGDRMVTKATEAVHVDKIGQASLTITLPNLGNMKLWDTDSPHLYNVIARLLVDGKPVHDYRIRTGLRDARFELEGFFLNGRRLQLFGLNRHEIYPYVGGAMPPRVTRRDAEMLRRELNCNIVRCSHYPQSEPFLNACDELGLMVWEETPGWGYLGDDAWKELLVRDVGDMILRDRNHPAIVIWGVRANESANDVALYRRTTALAKSLDDSRPDSGSMTPDSRKDWQEHWHEDVFAFDDYHAEPDGSVGIEDPVPGFPYLVTEAVGQFDYTQRKNFTSKYRRAGDVVVQQVQAVRHAQAHSRAAANPRICGVIGWCAFDYASLINSYNNVKTPGIADVFRIPKLGASFYQAQGDPKVRPIIQPSFYWDFGSRTPHGPGKHAAIFSNCDRLELFIAGQRHSTLYPDAANFPNLKHPPFFADLELDGSRRPELRIEGYLGNHMALTRSFSSDSSQDKLMLSADDAVLSADGADATRIVFKVVDKFGAERAFAGGEVAFELTGPGVIVGDNPFSLADSGGVGAIWVKSLPDKSGSIRVNANHSTLGTKMVEIAVRAAEK